MFKGVSRLLFMRENRNSAKYVIILTSSEAVASIASLKYLAFDRSKSLQ